MTDGAGWGGQDGTGWGGQDGLVPVTAETQRGLTAV